MVIVFASFFWSSMRVTVGSYWPEATAGPTKQKVNVNNERFTAATSCFARASVERSASSREVDMREIPFTHRLYHDEFRLQWFSGRFPRFHETGLQKADRGFPDEKM